MDCGCDGEGHSAFCDICQRPALYRTCEGSWCYRCDPWTGWKNLPTRAWEPEDYRDRIYRQRYFREYYDWKRRARVLTSQMPRPHTPRTTKRSS